MFEVRGPGRLAVIAAGALSAALLVPATLRGDTNKLEFDQKIELIQGLSAEFATAVVTLPRADGGLEIHENGTWDEEAWEKTRIAEGTAARPGDMVQITHVDFDDDKLTIELNDGSKQKKSIWDRISIGMGSGGQTTPITQQQRGPQRTNAQIGTTIELRFEDSIAGVTSERVKELLKPVLDFDAHTATELYVETLPPPVQEAIQEERAIVGMDFEQVQLALGRPRSKVREYREGTDYEEWIYGQPPGVIRFIVFANQRVVEVKEEFAGMGGTFVQIDSPDQ